MDSFTKLHGAVGVVTVIVAAIAATWGIWRSRAGTLPPSPREAAAWRQLTAGWQTLVVATGMLGLVPLLRGHAHPDPLHVRVYGPFMLVAIVSAWSFRTSDSRWNMRVMAVAAMFAGLLGVRALVTGY